jgi:glycosyltransferase involved in cell wall biosynthesis
VALFETRDSGGLLGAQVDAAGVERTALGRRGRFDLAPFRRLLDFTRGWQPDVIHAHMFGSNVWGSLLARRVRVPVLVAHEHGTTFDGAGGAVMRNLNRFLIAPRADAMVVGTDGEGRRMIEAAHVPPERVVMIPAPYVSRPDEPHGDLREELGIGRATPLVGTVAWLRPEKALEVLLEAFAAVAAAEPAPQLVIAGDGICRERLEGRARDLGIADRTHFLGAREDVATVLSALDVGASCSDRESTSMFALESIAHGVPLVCTRVGGAAEILEDGVSGYLVPTRDSDALAERILSLLRDPERRRQFAHRAAESIDRFSPERVVSRYLELYRRLLDGGRRSR